MTPVLHDRPRTARLRKAAAATEFALVLPLLLVVALAGVDFGRFAYSFIGVSNAVRAGAGYAILHPEDSATTRSAAVQLAARNEMANMTGVDVSHLTTVTTLTREPPTSQHPTNMYRVRVDAQYDGFVPFVSWVFLPGKITMARSIEMRMIR